MSKPTNHKRIEKAVLRLCSAKTKGELGIAISEEILRYSLQDLAIIGGNIKRETDKLPSPYREKIRPYFDKQLFGMYHRLLVMYRSGRFRTMTDQITDKKTYESYCSMIETGCYSSEEASGTDFYLGNPVNTLFYYLISAFAMFVMEEPGHPQGTPFPGGFIVEKRQDGYFCPLRDKEEDIPFSICNYCPAKQMEGV
ncbi:MAG: DUF2115 domain-containing protein [Methanospirillaceae archaeon]|nr:DUF2115 domain-containing protein [Methanospirillaceae archaeon]